MTKPYLIILDEPCAGMDPGARENFLASLRQLGQQKRVPALIYVTHHIEEILPGFRHTLVLREGKILYVGLTSGVLRHKVLKDLYGVDFTLMKRNGRYWPVMK
jgi:iron complex transport system ATP-binding protein